MIKISLEYAKKKPQTKNTAYQWQEMQKRTNRDKYTFNKPKKSKVTSPRSPTGWSQCQTESTKHNNKAKLKYVLLG